MDFSLISDLAIGSVAIAPLIIGLVSLAKHLGLPTRYAPWLTGSLSILGFAVVKVLQDYPAFVQSAEYVANGVLIFLVTSGVYQLSKTKKQAGIDEA